MKNMFDKPIIEIYKLSVHDVVCTSNGFGPDTGEDSGDAGDGNY